MPLALHVLIALQLITKGVDHPVDLTHDGSARMFIVEQRGTIRIFENGQLAQSPFLDITDRVFYQGECGLLGLAFHPDFKKNGLFYVDYTTKKPKLHTVIAEYKADGAHADKNSERILLTIDQPYANHNGGQVRFGPDKMLYIAMGDGGSAGDPQNRAQNLDEFLGKILRIDVNAKPYAVPKDNPFVKTPGARPEIWTWGMRNPWRFSFDRKTGDCYCGDVGQDRYEEIDILTKGGNYGWRLRESMHPFTGAKLQARLKGAEKRQDLIEPIVEYDHSFGLSITGGFVYRGKAFPMLDGIYFYADYQSGRFWGLRYDKGKVLANQELAVTINGRGTRNKVQPSSFGEDVDGELYVCDHNGAIYQITATEQP